MQVKNHATNAYKLYPGEETFKYPKAGEKNSNIQALVYEIRSKTSIPVDLGQDTDIYVPRLKWTPDANDLVVMRLNRRQNQLDMLLCQSIHRRFPPVIDRKK